MTGAVTASSSNSRGSMINNAPREPGVSGSGRAHEPVPNIAIPPSAMNDELRSVFARNYVRGADGNLNHPDKGVQERAWREFGRQGQTTNGRWSPAMAAAAFRAITGNDPTPQQMAWYREGASEMRIDRAPRGQELNPRPPAPLLRGLADPHDH